MEGKQFENCETILDIILNSFIHWIDQNKHEKQKQIK